MSSWIIETPFGFNLDLSFWAEVLTWPTGEAVRAIFAIVGWAVLILIFFFMGAELWLWDRQRRYMSNWKWVLLAVDVPPLTIQTPKAVEQIFAHLSGAKISSNIGQKYWTGRKQKWFSFEIISIEGYTQFLLRTEVEFRDLVEAAIYAQYPEAEITEVEDYVHNIPTKYPDNDYDVFGLEFRLSEADAYPIRSYKDFEYQLSKDAVFSDPMAALLENFSRIGHGENFWMQIIVEPTGNDWKEKGIALVKKIIANKKEKFSNPVIDFMTKITEIIFQELSNIWNWTFEPSPASVAEVEPPGKVMELSPGVKSTVEAIEEKISKIGFKSKIRALYSGRREVYNPSRCLQGFVGALNQFHVIGRNAIVPHSETQAYYAFKNFLSNWKKTVFAGGFKWRLLKRGATPYILNIEELATIWHFPLPFVKTPLLQKAMVRRGEPPIGLPVETLESPLRPITKQALAEAPPPPPPEELPYA